MSFRIRRSLTTDEHNRLAPFPPLLAHLLFHRGVTDKDVAEMFVSPEYGRDLHDPFLLKDAERAAERIVTAIKANEKIAIYSDYDADGIPGAAMWNDFFGRIGYKNFIIYIPHRHDEGFGLNGEAVTELALQGVTLLVTLDCGITDVEPVKLAVEKGVDVIITDHHEPPPVLPPAYAIVDHKQADCLYPEKILCGTGVAFKLIQAILKKAKDMGEPLPLKEGMEKWFLDLVGIATMSDMVPLVGENRALAYYGMSVLRKSPRKGIMQLLHKLKISQKHLSEDDIAFMITPRINAASRMGVPMDAFRLLAADNDDDAYASAEHLDKINNERKGVVAALVKEVKKIVHERHSSMPLVIVLGNPAWKPSLLGLAANSCAEEFDRPVFLWGRDGDDAIKGSCRSEGRTHVVELMRAAPAEAFSQFGGHKHSGGFAVANEEIHYLEQRLNEAAEKIAKERSDAKDVVKDITGVDAVETIRVDDDMIDMELSLDAISSRLWNDIDKLAPFGTGNPKPLFIFRKVAPFAIRRFGKANDHVELSFKKTSGEMVSAISFFGAESAWAKAIKDGVPIDLVATLEKSMFRGRAELRLRVVDVIY